MTLQILIKRRRWYRALRPEHTGANSYLGIFIIRRGGLVKKEAVAI